MKLFKKSVAFLSALCLGLFLVCGLTSCNEEDPSKFHEEALARLSLLLDEKVDASNENTDNPGLAGSLEVPYSISVNDIEFVVTYTTDSTNAVPTVDAEAKTAEITITQTGETQNFTLTATIGEKSKSWDFSIAKKDISMIKTQAEVDAMENNLTYQQWAEASSGKDAIVQGYVTHAHGFSASYGNASVWLQDDNGGYYGYRVKVASQEDFDTYFAEGNKIAIVGKVSPYNGWQEMAAGCTYYYISDAEPKTYEFKDVTELWSANNATSAAATAVQNQKIKVTGKVTNIPDASTDSMTLGISVGGNDYSVFFKKDYTKMPGDLNTTLKIGYTIEVTGYGSVSKSGVQICPATPDAITVVSETVTPQDMVNGAIAEVKNQDVLSAYYDSMEDSLELLTKTSAGCTVTYELSNVTGEGITLIDGNKLNVVVDENAASKATLTATITLEGAEEAKTYTWSIATKTNAEVISEITNNVKRQGDLRLEYTADLVGSRQRLLVLTSPSSKELTYSYSVSESENVKVGQFSSGQYYFDVKGVPTEGAEKVTLTCTFTYGGVETSVEFTIVLGEIKPISIAEALKLEDGASVLVQGVVTKIGTPYSESYGNISVDITDSTGTLYLYRLKGNVQVGDIITVSGTMATYNSNRQVAAGATFEKSGKSIADVLATEDGKQVVVAGTVTDPGTWNESYGNTNATISDGKDSLYLYRLATKVGEGDQIVVFGTVGSYNGSKQIAQGGVAVIVVSASVEIPTVEPEHISTTVTALATTKPTTEKDVVYEVTGTWELKDGGETYGNGWLKAEDGKQIVIYGLCASDSVLSWAEGVYTFANDKSYSSINISTGAVIKVGMIYTSGYDNYSAYIIEVVSAGGTETPTPDPEPTVVTNIADALLAADGAAVELTGTVVSVDSAWDDYYGNMSVTIQDETGNTMYVFRLATLVAKGDKIKVTGTMGTYNESRQVAQGATAEILEKAPVEETTNPVIEFASKDNRTSFSTEQQVWEMNGIKVTNDKAASTTNIADYANPVRFYANSSLTIEYTSNITKIIITTAGGKNFAAGTTFEGATVTVDGTTTTIELTTPATSFVIAALAAQVRVASIEIVAE